MRKSLLIIGVLIFGSSFLSSCNKKLKEDIEAMEKQVADLKDQQNQTDAIIGSNEPISATTKFVNDEGDTVIIVGNYKFKSSDYSTQYMEQRWNGTYDIYIERFSDVEWYEGVNLYFNYDPLTRQISNKYCRHYWYNPDFYSDAAYYTEDLDNAPSLNITLHSIDLNTGQISLSVTASADGDYTQEVYNEYSSNYVPNAGEYMSTKFSFAGKLKKFDYSEENSESF